LSPWILSDMSSERGTGLIEYTIVVAMVALIAVAGVRMFGEELACELGTHGPNLRAHLARSGIFGAPRPEDLTLVACAYDIEAM